MICIHLMNQTINRYDAFRFGVKDKNNNTQKPSLILFIFVLILRSASLWDISDEIVFLIYNEMHLNNGKLEIKCIEN